MKALMGREQVSKGVTFPCRHVILIASSWNSVQKVKTFDKYISSGSKMD